MKKFIRNSLKFTSIFIISSVLSLLIIHPYYGERWYSTKLTYFNRNRTHFNTVIFGSSQSYRQINPQKLDYTLGDYNTSTFNFATAGTGQPEIYFLYEKFLKTIKKDTVKYAVMEISPLKYTDKVNLYTPKNYYWHTLANLIYSIKYTLSSNYSLLNKLKYIKLYTHSYLLKLIKSFRFLFESGPIEDPYFLGKNIDGFLPLEKEMQDHPEYIALKKRHNILINKPDSLKDIVKLIKQYFLKKDHKENLNIVHLKRLLYLIDISEKKGIHLFFLIPPRWRGLDELLAIKEQLPFNHLIELADPQKYPELYAVENHFDIGHLNMKGAGIYTEYLGREMIARLNHAGLR